MVSIRTEICQLKKSVAKTLVARNLETCFNASSGSEGLGVFPDLSEDYASDCSEQNQVGCRAAELKFVSESTQLMGSC